MNRSVPLEPAAEAVCQQNSIPPFIYQLPPRQGRQRLEQAQNAPVFKHPANVTAESVDTGKWGTIPVYFVTPVTNKIEKVILYIHGAGWVFGSFHTHEKLVRELCARTNALVVFPEYTLSPEAKYPTALEQCYHVLCHLDELICGLCPHLTGAPHIVAGDSVGGNLAIGMELLSQQHHGPKIKKLLLYYPVTNACFETQSYRQFATGYYLSRAQMEWFWDQYIPRGPQRMEPTASPLRANSRNLAKFPPTMVINGQADVLRSEGEAFAQRLLRCGVDVTALEVKGTIHDFVMLNALDQTNATRAAMDASTQWLNRPC